MRILVDVTTWIPGRSGVGLYTERLLRALHDLQCGDELLLATNRGRDDVDIPGRRVGPQMPVRALWMQTALPFQSMRLRPDIALYPNYLGPLVRTCPYVVTVHDMAVQLFPETFTFKKRVLQRSLLPAILRRADAILTPSASTRRDLLRLLGVDPQRVAVTHLAADPAFHRVPTEADEARVVAARGLPERYLLAVCTLEPRKNLVRLVQAFERIAGDHPGLRLLLVGGRGWRDAGIQQALERSPARHLIDAPGYVAFDELQIIYRRALALCYPSLYEGFGLPVVEAMASGAPVLVSRGSSLDEVAAGAAVTVDPLDVQAMAEGMDRLVRDEALRGRLRRQGLSRAAELSWTRTAQQTRAVFERVLAGEAPAGPESPTSSAGV